MKKRLLIYILVLSMFALAACGKDSKKTTEGTSEEIVPYQPSTYTDASTTEALTMDESGFYVTDDYVMTVGDTINVRVSPSTDSSIYSLLGGGEVLKRTGYNDEWTRVLMDNTNFYIHSELVEITEAPPEAEIEDDDEESEPDEPKLAKKIVIDAGNQTNPNVSQEAIGPGSEETKQGITSGNTGATLGTKEYEINLIYAKALKAELEKRGYDVTLTREENEVDLTNQARAQIANTSGATTFIRIQMNYSANSELNGVMAMTMTSDSPYNASLHDDSYKLATRILQGATEKTGAINHGIYETNQLTAVNWSDIPVVVINLGYLSNSQDETNLLDENYQKDMVNGIADGIDYFYN
ncbi:MAG: N-acetylmuramoyl-L-alanine amidase [Lachnospiraceae bacterium]|nr:N-acetylmuramoyl-L-alanine amidase [Lachnospiraceae bacterium]MBQ9233533.1 N-acetylmuramoyl-L-alanine amidase [Lachnospiraceae bacterium]